MAHGRIRFGQTDVDHLADTLSENPHLTRHYEVLRQRVYDAERSMGEFFADFLDHTPRDTEDIDFLIQGVDAALEDREVAPTARMSLRMARNRRWR
jgi:hypothetical protein